MKDIFEVQDETAQGIANKLELSLGGGTANLTEARRTDNLEAYMLYLRAVTSGIRGLHPDF